LPEDAPMNPGVIADNVGDNVGDIAGMGSDLFGSFAESSCACLIISATSPELISSGAYYFPLMITAAGIYVCLIVSFVATTCMVIQLLISYRMLTAVLK
jgi:H+-translocating diphosphatase